LTPSTSSTICAPVRTKPVAAYARAFARIGERDFPADAAGGAGDDGNLSFELHDISLACLSDARPLAQFGQLDLGRMIGTGRAPRLDY
jgi:hypothetical protein